MRILMISMMCLLTSSLFGALIAADEMKLGSKEITVINDTPYGFNVYFANEKGQMQGAMVNKKSRQIIRDDSGSLLLTDGSKYTIEIDADVVRGDKKWERTLNWSNRAYPKEAKYTYSLSKATTLYDEEHVVVDVIFEDQGNGKTTMKLTSSSLMR